MIIINTGKPRPAEITMMTNDDILSLGGTPYPIEADLWKKRERKYLFFNS